MSRRKVRGLTRTGRQVSEDPDLDNLLSTLSPEEVEELEKDMMKVPDIKPEEGKIIVQGESRAAPRPTGNGVQDAKPDGRREGDRRGKLGDREQSFEGETKKESRKQEYLRKMGLSQEGNDDGTAAPQGPTGVASERGAAADSRDRKGPESAKEERSRLSSRYSKPESREGDAKEETREKREDRTRDRRESRESTGGKTKDMVSKLQDKKDEGKERKGDCRRRDEGKTKDLVSRLREKHEKDPAKERERKSEGFRTQGLVSKMLEKQSKAQESPAPQGKPEGKKPKAEEKRAEEGGKPDAKPERPPPERADKAEKRTDREELVNHSDRVKEKEEEAKEKEEGEKEEGEKEEEKVEEVKEKEEGNGRDTEKRGNCVAKGSPSSKAKEGGEGEEDEDEDASMFDELMERVRGDDPALTELNVNNSEVIKTKTLMEFAEALRANTHVTKLALANCRADDHVAYAIAGTLRCNKTITSINVDSNHLTGKGILALIQALPHNCTLTELRFQNQRHICGGKTEMEMTKILKENTTLLKLGYHFELAGPRMTTTNILSRNMDRQRQRRLQEQKQAQANGEKKGALEVPKAGGGGSLRNSPRASPKPSPMPSPVPSPKLTPKRGGGGPPPPPPPPGCGPPPPPPPMLDVDSLRNSLTPVSQRKLDGKSPGGSKNTRDQLLDSIRGNDKKQLKKVPVPKWLQ